MTLSGQRVLVLGLGESGLAMARWLTRQGALLRVADTREAPVRLAALQESIPEAQFIGGAFAPALLDGVQLVAVSPGLAPNKELASLLPAAKEQGIPICGEIELFAQALAALHAERGYAPKVIAITGTNGKTTVTSMVGLLCRRAGLSVAIAGNISPAALDVLCECLDENTLPQVWVLELSSFQLETTSSLQADAATILNITQDHLDWHGDMEAYTAAKMRIFGPRTARIVNLDDPSCKRIAAATGVELIGFSSTAPRRAGDFGLVAEHGMQWLSTAVADDQEEKKRNRKNQEPVALHLTRLMPSDALQVRGEHNAVNALAALALCKAIGLPLSKLLHGLREYRGEPHRVELVATVNGVAFYDDSKGTNVGATVAALNGLGRDGSVKRLVLIAGGQGKGQDFSPLAEPVVHYVAAVMLIGADAGRIRAALNGRDIALHDCASLEEATQRAFALAHAGDAVLLSPACASLDMFRNYAHRAEVFVNMVREIALANGEVMA